jgi:hypothetical protein
LAPSSKKGWENIKIELPYGRMITQSRWQKFMVWKHPRMEANCKTVLYFDVSSRPRNGAWLDYVAELVPKVLSSEVGLAMPKHPRSKIISQEFNAIL